MSKRTEQESALLEVLKQPSRIKQSIRKLKTAHEMISEQLKLNMIKPEKAVAKLDNIEEEFKKLLNQYYLAVCSAYDYIRQLPDITEEDDKEITVLICYYLGGMTVEQVAEVMDKGMRIIHMYKSQGLKRLASLLPDAEINVHSA